MIAAYKKKKTFVCVLHKHFGRYDSNSLNNLDVFRSCFSNIYSVPMVTAKQIPLWGFFDPQLSIKILLKAPTLSSSFQVFYCNNKIGETLPQGWKSSGWCFCLQTMYSFPPGETWLLVMVTKTLWLQFGVNKGGLFLFLIDRGLFLIDSSWGR